MLCCEDCWNYNGIRCTEPHPDDGRSIHEPGSHTCPNFRKESLMTKPTEPEVQAIQRLDHEIKDTLKTVEGIVARAKAALQPLVNIADAYDANGLDDEARKFWGKDNEHECQTPPDELELYSGRGGKRLLTLGDCFRARAVVDEVEDLLAFKASLQWAPQPDGLPPKDPTVVSGQQYHQVLEVLRYAVVRGDTILQVGDPNAAINWLVDWIPEIKKMLRS